MEVSGLFVTLMGMGVTFVGLTTIILLTTLMGKVLGSNAAPEAPKPVPAPAPVVPAAPAVPADGLTAEVKVAIMAALAQEPGLDLSRVSSVDIRRI